MRFPDPRTARGDIVALGGDLELETLREAYRRGIFPWPHDHLPMPWFSPRKRTVIVFEELHLGRTVRRLLKRHPFTLTIDQSFGAVIRACAAVPREDDGTWIGPEIVDAYERLHHSGDAHSVEAWHDGTLAGGLYGVDAGGVFTGESMFHTMPDASRVALLFLIEHLASRGATWLDCQVTTPHMEALGSREIPRSVFLDRLAETQRRTLRLFGP